MNTASVRATSSPAGGRIRPSTAIPALMVLLIVLSLVAILATGWSAWLKALVSILTLAYAGREVLGLLRPPWRSVKIVDRELMVQNRQHQSFRVELRSAPFISPIFIGFHGCTMASSRPIRVGIFRGQLDDHDFRRLSVGLRNLLHRK